MGTISVDKILRTSTGAAEFTLPATDGTAGQVMQTDGSGQLSLADVGTGGNDVITANAVGTTQIAAGAVTANEMAANAIVTVAISDANVTPAKMSGPVPGNLIINGNFDVWQRGTAFTTNNVYMADRWKIYATGSSPATSRQTFTPGQTDVPNFPNYYLRYNNGTAPSAVGEINQYIEDVGMIGGKTLTVTVWAKASSGTPNLGLLIFQNFGSGGSGNTTVYSSTTTWTLSTTWTKYTHTQAIDSISGKTIGAASYTAYRFQTAANANNLDIAQVQLEEGSVSHTFEQKTFGQELLACQRYYCKSFAQGTTPANGNGVVNGAMLGKGVTTDNTEPFLAWQYPVVMRATPTVTLYNHRSGGTAGQWDNHGSSSGANARVIFSNDTTARVDNSDVKLASANAWMIHATAAAEL